MSKIPERGKESGLKSMGERNKFLSRITKTLYYGKLPKTDCLSLPVSELASELFSEAQKGRSLQRLYCEDATTISRNACVSPCSFVLALLYLERLKSCNPEYVRHVAPSKLFLVSLMVSSKFLHDDGEEDEVFTDEWARSGEISLTELCQLEKEFLCAIDWNLFVGEPAFWERLEKLETDLAVREGTKRGWFTYTELKYLVNGYELTNLVHTLVAISAVLAATYAVGVLTLAGSVFLTSRVPGTSLHNQLKKDIVRSSPTFDGASAMNVTAHLGNIHSADVEDVNLDVRNCYNKLHAVNVLKTGLILASITCQDEHLKHNRVSVQPDCSDCSSWDWWNNPLMKWLSDISKSADYQSIKLPYNYCKTFAREKLLDMCIASQKKLDLQDKIHKATKLRLQEQMERSWHAEWTDTVYTNLSPYLKHISAY